MEDLERIFEIFSQYYDHANTSPEIVEFVDSFPTNINNLEICKNILQLQESPYTSKVAAANSFRLIISNFVHLVNFKEFEGVVDWIIEFLTTSTIRLEDIFYKDLSAAAATIFTKFYESFFKIIDLKVGSFSVLKNSDPIYLKPFVMIHSEILDAFRNSTDKTCEIFLQKDRLIETFFNSIKEILLRTEVEQDPIFSLPPEEIKDIVEESCSNLAKCIAIQKDKDTTHTNDLIKSELANKELLSFLFHLYEKFSEPAALDAVASYFNINSTYMPPKIYAEVMDNIFQDLSRVIQEQIGFDEKSIFRISIILSNLSRLNFRKCHSYLQNFYTLIDSVTQFSITCFRDLSDQPNVVENVVNFWPNVEKFFHHQENPQFDEFIAPKAFDIYSVYIEYLLNVVLSDDSNIIDIISSDNKVSPSISPIQSFLDLNTPQIYEHLMEFYQMKKKEFMDCLSASSESINDVQKQIAVFIQIFIKLLQSNAFTEKGEFSNRICIDSFTEIFSLIQITNEPLAQGALFTEIETSFSIFIWIFPSLFFGNNQTRVEVIDAFYHEISRSLSISNPQMCQDIFFQRIITAIQSFFESPVENIIIQNLLDKLAQKVTPSRECVLGLLQINFDESFNFVRNPKYRTLFMNSLMTIITKYPDLYEDLFGRFISKFEALSSLDIIVMLATDIRGLFLKNINASYYHMQINSLFPDKMKVFAESLQSIISSSPSEQDLEAINLSLKMCKSIVSPNVQIDNLSTKHIEFGHSAMGITLFSFSAQLISVFLAYMGANSENQDLLNRFVESGFREFKCCLKILTNLISSGYVPFDAFLIYDDHVYVDVLAGFIQFTNALDLDNICHYPKTFLSLINFFKELCKKLLRITCIQLPAELLTNLMVIIFECATRGLNETNTSASSIKTIEYILQFIVDDQYSKEVAVLMSAISEDELAKANAGLWQLLINSYTTTDRNLVSEPIKYMIQINESAFLVIKEKLLEIAEEMKDQEIIEAVANFERDLIIVIKEDNSDAMRNILIQLKGAINQKISSVSFI